MKKLSKRYNFFNAAFAIIAGAAFLYLITKAATMLFVLDEATTFVEFVQTGDFWPGNSRWTTNNHLLNTGLEWVSFKTFGDSEFALRLPNLLSFLLFAIALFRLANRLKSTALKIVLLLGLLAPVYILDFFAMARGYGLSFAFLVFSLASWLRIGERKSAYFWAEFALFVAVLANLSIIYVWPAFWLASAVRDKFYRHLAWKKVLLNRLISAVLFAPHIYYALLLKQNFTFDLGVDLTIFESFFSHISAVFFRYEKWSISLLAAFAGMLIILIVSKSIRLKLESIFFAVLTFITIAVYLFLYALVNAPLPIGRVSLHLYLLWFPTLVFWTDGVCARLKSAVASMVYLLVFLSSIELFSHFSISSHSRYFWQREQFSVDIIREMKKDKYARQAVGANQFYRGNIQFQRLKDPKFPYVNTYNFPQQNAKYLLVCNDELDLVPANFSAVFRSERFSIVQRNTSFNKTLLTKKNVTVKVDANTFQLLAEVHTEANVASADVNIAPRSAHHKNSLVLLCFAVSNAQDETIFWNAEPLNHYFYKFSGQELEFHFATSNLPEGTKKVSVFLWEKSGKSIDKVNASTAIFFSQISNEIGVND